MRRSLTILYFLLPFFGYSQTILSNSPYPPRDSIIGIWKHRACCVPDGPKYPDYYIFNSDGTVDSFGPFRLEKCHYNGKYKWHYIDSFVYINTGIKYFNDTAEHITKMVLMTYYLSNDTSIHRSFNENSLETITIGGRKTKKYRIKRNTCMTSRYTDENGIDKRSDEWFCKIYSNNIAEDSTKLRKGQYVGR